MNKFADKNKSFIYRLDDNGGKLIRYGTNRKIFCYHRNRVDSTYYLTRIKGNWIKSFKIQYLLNGEPQNTYIAFTVGGLIDPQKAKEDANKTKTVKTLIVKSRFNEYEKHLQLFKQLTPDLQWFNNDEEENDSTTN